MDSLTVYIRDDAADTIVAKDAKLQAVVQGKAVMVWLPGQTAGVLVNTCLMFGWMGTMVSVYHMVPQLRSMMHWYALATVTVMSAMGVAWLSVLRGHRTGRSRMYAYAYAALVVAFCVAAVAVARSDWIGAGLAAAGLTLTLVAQRLVAGPSYALLSASFEHSVHSVKACSARSVAVASPPIRRRGGVKILKDVLIESGEVDKYFEGRVPVTLWRAKRKRSPDPPFHFVEQPIVFDDGTRRGADIKIEAGPDGRKWVRIEFRPRGVSTFDKPRVFRGKQWEYYKIEGGTELPRGLAIVKDYFNEVYGAWHYTVAPAWDMHLDTFKELLKLLAEKLVKEVA